MCLVLVCVFETERDVCMWCELLVRNSARTKREMEGGGAYMSLVRLRVCIRKGWCVGVGNLLSADGPVGSRPFCPFQTFCAFF